MKNACFIGHWMIDCSNELNEKIRNIIKNLIAEGVKYFIFGSHSRFDELCLKILSDLKEKYPFIKRVYIRGEYEYIDSDYENYLSETYDDSFFSTITHKAGWFAYIQQNQRLIDISDVCIFYYDKSKQSRPNATKSAFKYAVGQKKAIINVSDGR